MMIIDKPSGSEDKRRKPAQPDRRRDDQAIDDELTEALKGTFPGSDPVALESTLVNRSPNKKRS